MKGIRLNLTVFMFIAVERPAWNAGPRVIHILVWVTFSPMVWYESIKLLGRVDRMTIVRHSQDDVIRSVRWLIRDLSVPFSRRYMTGGGTHSALSKTDRPLLWPDKLRLCRTDKITLRNSRFCRSYSIINVFHAIVVSPISCISNSEAVTAVGWWYNAI